MNPISPLPDKRGPVRGPLVPTRRQRGVIMVIALVTLAFLLIGAVAAIRSMSASLGSVGNFGFKRDMTNQAERAIRLAANSLTAGALAPANVRETDQPTMFYSAKMLPTSPQGIPNVLLNANTAGAVNGLGYIDMASGAADQAMRIHYVIDRLCLNPGALDTLTCQTSTQEVQGGKGQPSLTPPPQAIFRISVRVTGPRDAQSFYQATYTAL